MFFCFKSFVLGWVTPSSTMFVAGSGQYGKPTGTALSIGDSRKTRPRFTTNNASASCALRSIPVLFHPNNLRSVWRNDGTALVGHKFTGSSFSWGIPHKALLLTTRHRDATPFIICSPAHTAATPYRFTTATPFLLRLSSIAAPFSYRQRNDFTPFRLLGYHVFFMGLLISIIGICDYLSNLLASQLTLLWGLLVSLTNCLKIIGGVTGIFTEADLLSCIPVRLGPEDATDFVSTIFRGADLVSTSQFKVTNTQASSSAVNLAPTHSSLAPSSLSFYLRGISLSTLYVVLLVVGRVWLNSFLDCSLFA